MIHRLLTPLSCLAGLVLALTAAIVPASAQEGQAQEKLAKDLVTLSFEQLVDVSLDSVYAASAYAQKISEAPASVSIVTREDIERFGYRTLADVLRGVRGFYVTNDRNYSYLGVRGFSRPGDYNARILLLVDGHRLNDNIFGSALLGTEFPLDIDLVERVEIVRGPSSSLYGTSAFFAVINVITKRPDAMGGGFEVAAALGSLGTRRGRVSFARALSSRTEVLLSASVFAADGQSRLYFAEFDDPATNDGIARHADGDEYQHFLGRVKSGDLTVQALHGSRHKVVPTASFGTVFGDPRSGTVETQQFVDAQYERTVAAQWTTTARAYVDRYAYDGTYPIAGVDAVPVMNLDFARGLWWGGEFKARKRLAGRHTLALGTEYRRNARQEQFNYDVDPYRLYLDDRRASTNWALFAQDEVRIHDRLLVNLGVRHDRYDTFGGTTNPRGALIYTPATGSTVKLLYGEAFRAPNAYELFWRQDDLGKPNPALRPERNQTSELVFEQAFGRAARLGATAFTYRIDDLITQQTDLVDDLLVYNNVERVEARGIELEAEGRWAGGVTARGSWTYQDSKNVLTRERLTNSPAQVAQMLVRSPVRRGVFAAFESRYVSERRTIGGGRVKPLFVSNATLVSTNAATGLEITASFFNLFNQRFADPASEEHRQDSIFQNGRSLRLNVIYRFAGRK